jgi:hypothetical protein
MGEARKNSVEGYARTIFCRGWLWISPAVSKIWLKFSMRKGTCSRIHPHLDSRLRPIRPDKGGNMNFLPGLLALGLITTPVHVFAAESSDSARANDDMIRATYSKLVYATRLSSLREKYSSGVEPAKLHITLSPIRTGPVSEIRSTMLAALVSKPSGRTLAVTPVTWTYKTAAGNELHAEGASADWRDSPYFSEDWNLPIGQLLDNGTLDPGYTDYASFAVEISYLGEHREYQTLFLFGRDASGKEICLPIDPIIGLSTLLTLIQAPVTPDPLLADPFRNRPETREFLQALQAPAGCSNESRTQMCCDQTSGKCGVSTETLRQRGFPVSDSKKSHKVQTTATSECSANCSVFNEIGTADSLSGLDMTQYATGEHSNTVDGEGNSNTCRRSWATPPSLVPCV